MRKALVFLTVLAALAIPAVASANLHATDPTGDGNGAVDLTTVDVSNDSAGNITFNVGFVSQSLASDDHLILAIDTDANPSTGSGGVDVAFFLSATGWTYATWNGSQFAATTQHGAINVTLSQTNFTIKVNKADLGNTSKFNFYAFSDKGSFASTDPQDSAPDGTGVYTYSLATISGISLRVSSGQTVKAGKTLTVTPTIKLSDGTTAKPDSVSCTATLNGKPIAAGGCSVHVPKSAKGKTLKIKVTIQFQGQTFTTSVTVHVRKK